jgi:hypothetical protein
VGRAQPQKVGWQKGAPGLRGAGRFLTLCVATMKKLTDEQYAEKLKAQGGGCAICGRKPNPDAKRRYCQDHNHKSGKLRGLLCFICNGKILGRLERFAHYATLPQIARYLEQFDPDAETLKSSPFDMSAKQDPISKQFRPGRTVEYVQCVCALHTCLRVFELQPAVYRQRLQPTVRRNGVVTSRNKSGKLYCSKRCSQIAMRLCRVKADGWERVLIAHGLGMESGTNHKLVYGYEELSVTGSPA